MTLWTLLQIPGWQSLAEGLPFLLAPADSCRLVNPTEWQPTAAAPEVVLGAHGAAWLGPAFAAAPNVVLYETENVLDLTSPWQPAGRYLRDCLGRDRPQWTHSAANAARFGDFVVPLRCPPRSPPVPRALAERPLDVFFAGSPNPRRLRLLTELAESGLRVDWVHPREPVFGPALAARERQAKCVLNVHYYMPGVFEAWRCVPAAARGSHVISETSELGEGADVADQLHPYGELAGAVVHFCKSLKNGAAE